MTLRFATDSELAHWNELVLANPDGGSVLQSAEMAEVKARGGWQPRFIVAESLAFVALERQVLGLGKLWYVIKGPGIETAEQLEALVPELKEFANKNGVFAVKIEPEIVKTNEVTEVVDKLDLTKVRNVQPNASTIFLDLSGSLDEIMASLNQKGRHALRRAERDGATVEQVPATDENCKIMYDLYRHTAEGLWTARPYAYYKHYWQSFEAAGMGQLFFAYADGKLAAGAYALIFGKKSTYKDGASLRERPVYGLSHLLQWHVIKWAKSRGAAVHDLCGSPPSDQIKNPDHPYYGFGRFKTSFSKNVVDFIGTYDIIVRPTKYKIWASIGERVALKLHFKRHGEIFY